jgi:uncharacterized protein (DUF58 family)
MTDTLSQLYRRFNQLRGRRIFIVPTRFGFVYAGFLLLILLGAINYSSSLGHVLCFLLGSLGLVAMLHTYRNLAKIELHHAFSEPVFCGEMINFTVLFDNQSHHDCYQLDVASKQVLTRTLNPFRLFKGYKHHYLVAILKAQKTTAMSITLSSDRRGYQPLGRIRIASQFPLGLYTTWSYFNTNASALVYPKPVGRLPLPTATDHGQQSNHHKQSGVDDFSGFDIYRTGDPIHAIAWKAMARDDVMRTKQFTSSMGGTVILSWQHVAPLRDTEARLSQLSLWILQAEAAGINYGLSLATTTINYGHGKQHRHRCLSALALYE